MTKLVAGRTSSVETDSRGSNNNKEVVIRSGSMYDAIRASCSIPGLVKPYSLNGVDYVDGGVLNPLPINKLHYRENIITVNLNSHCSPPAH